jgi:uncharacterized cofD-like protein
VIIIGPGSLFTSLIPNLLVHGIPKAIAASPAVKAFVCNLMTEANESLGLSAADHIRLLHSHARLSLVDYAIVNQTAVSAVLRAKYAVAGGSPVPVDLAEMESLGVKVISGDYLETTQGVARHANDRLAQDLLQLCSFRKARDCLTPILRSQIAAQTEKLQRR